METEKSRIEKRDITFPRHAGLMSEINNFSIAIKLYYGVGETNEGAERTAKIRQSIPKPTWRDVSDFLDKIQKELNEDRYSPAKHQTT